MGLKIQQSEVMISVQYFGGELWNKLYFEVEKTESI
jgi:hypothetical protein